MQTVIFRIWTESWGRLPMYLLMGRSSLNVVHAWNLFFFLEKKKKWVQDMLTSGLMDLKFWTCFLEVHWNWILDVLPRGPMDWSLDMLPRGPMDLKFGRASQRSDGLKFGRASQKSVGFEIWTCFPEVQWFEVWTCFLEVWLFDFWTCFLEVRWIWNLNVLPRGSMDLKFGHASQRSDGLKFGRAS